MGGGSDTWILDADIKGAFDNISHEYWSLDQAKIHSAEVECKFCEFRQR
jgi:retron-type reverse transcriptase